MQVMHRMSNAKNGFYAQNGFYVLDVIHFFDFEISYVCLM
jgi:hypothetical protein